MSDQQENKGLDQKVKIYLGASQRASIDSLLREELDKELSVIVAQQLMRSLASSPSPPRSPNHVGFWLSGECGTEEVASEVDPDWEKTPEYTAVVKFCMKPDSTISYRGWSNCRVCGCRNGNQEYHREGFIFPQGYLHYVMEHNVKPPQPFIDAACQAYPEKEG